MPEVDAYIAVGANLAPARNIQAALMRLLATTRVTAVATFYRTASLRRPEQPFYRNGVLRVRTDRSPSALKYGILRPIETALGRVRTEDRWAAREMDLDLVVYDALENHDPHLPLPDPVIGERAFLAKPLLALGAPLPEPLRMKAMELARLQLQPDHALTQRLRQLAGITTT